MILQPRDLEILNLCYEQQFLSVHHVVPLFANGSKPHALRRIRELRQAGMIETQNGLHQEHRLLIRLTKLGLRMARARAHHDVPTPGASTRPPWSMMLW